jgi:hypothetical protein
MHPPRKRNTKVANTQHPQIHQASAISHQQIATRGRTQRSAPTQSFFLESQIITDQPDNAPRGGM